MTGNQPHKLRRVLLGTLIGLLLVVGIGFAAFRFALARVPEYQARLQTLVKERTGLVIEFEKVDAKLRAYGPEVVFYRAVLSTPEGRVLASARRGSVSLAVGSTLLNRKLMLGRLSLDGPEIGIVRTVDGEFRIIGHQPLQQTEERFELTKIPEGRLRIRDARLRFLDEQRERDPWVLSKVELRLARTGRQLLIEGSSELPAELGESLQFDAEINGDLAQPAALETEFNLRGGSLHLARWRGVLAPDLAKLSGIASLDVQSRWSGRALTSLTAQVDGREIVAGVPAWTIAIPAADPLQVKLDNADANDANATAIEPVDEIASPGESAPKLTKQLPDRVAYERLAAKIEVHQSRGTWRLDVTDFDLQQPDVNIASAKVRANWRRSAERLEQLDLQADVVPIAAVWPLLAWLPEEPRFARVRALEGRGTLSDVKASYRAAEGSAAARYNFEARATEVGFEPVLRTPGLSQLAFTISGDERGGTLQLRRTPVSFSWPRIFRDRLTLDSAQGDLQWTRAANGWQIETQRFDIANAHGRVQTRLKLTLPADGTSPLIDMHADAFELDARATPRYLPAGNLGQKSLAWLDRAFVAGRLPKATVRLQGELRRFPFRDGGGEFVAKGELEDVTVDYQPEWLPATQIKGSVEFRNQGMHGDVQSAQVGGLAIDRATATFEDFKQSVLVLDAEVQADVFHALRYVQTSPLGEMMGRPFLGLTGRGASRFDVDVSLPLKNLAARQVQVVAQFDNAWIDHDAVQAPVSRLRGDLTIENSQVRSAQVRGQWLGGPVDVNVEPNNGVSLLKVAGQARAADFGRLLRLPQTIHLSGTSRWQGQARLSAGDQKGSRASVRMELDETSVALPVPLAKSADQTRTLEAELELEDRAALIRATYGPVRGLARLQRDEARGWRFDRAGVRADARAPSLPTHAGVRIEGKLDRFILDDWLALAPADDHDRAKTSGRGVRVSDWLRAANVEVNEFGYRGYRWRDVRGVLQAQPDHWLIDVNGAQVGGRVQVPYELLGSAPLKLDLERLVVPERTPGSGPNAANEGDSPTDPRKFPSLQAKVNDFAIGSHRIGELTLSVARVASGLRIDNIEVRSPTFEGRSSGSWLMTPAGELTSLDLSLVSTDVRETLNRLNYRPFMQAKRAEINGKLAWPGGWSARYIKQASGQLAVAADEGTLLSVEPGAGRVLGLFSFSALPRRLSLDFSDLTQEGLSFDTIRGDFELRDGNAYTDNLVVSGPATEIGLAGRTGFEARDYDQTVVVTGKLGVSLPVAGALAGGPAVAAAVLLFSQIFKEPLKGIARGYYRITGTWENPVVERVHGTQAREAASAVPSQGAAAGESSP